MSYPCLLDDCDFESEVFNGRAQHMALAHTEEERRPVMIEEIHRTVDELGRPPTAHDLPEYGRIGRDMYENVFGSWQSALEAAGYEPDYHQHTEEELISELKRLGDELGRTPRRAEMDELGQFGTTVFRERFGSWNDALRTAGFEPVQLHGIGREELLQAIIDLGEQLGRTPKRKEMRNEIGYAERPFRRVFGTWNKALKAAGYEPNIQHDISEDDLLEAIQNLFNELGHVPTAVEMNRKGAYSVGTYQSRFGSWNTAIREAGLEPRTKGDGVSALYGPGWTDAKRQRIRERDGHECWSCNVDESTHRDVHGSTLEVHHIRPAREFPDFHPQANVPENLLTLCKVCHKRWEEAPNLVPSDETLPAYCDPPDASNIVKIIDYV